VKSMELPKLPLRVNERDRGQDHVGSGAEGGVDEGGALQSSRSYSVAGVYGHSGGFPARPLGGGGGGGGSSYADMEDQLLERGAASDVEGRRRPLWVQELGSHELHIVELSLWPLGSPHGIGMSRSGLYGDGRRRRRSKRSGVRSLVRVPPRHVKLH